MPDRRRVLAGGLAVLASGAAPRLARAASAPAMIMREIEARAGTASLLEDGGPLTDIWGFGGGVPGPVLRVEQGARVRVRLKNSLPQPTTIHWHGIRIDNANDGVAGLTQEAVPPGETFDYDFVAPDAGTFWYHPHNRSWEQLARGLYGTLIVDEPEPPAVDQDLVLNFDDWRLDSAGKLHEESFGSLMDWSHAGRLGNVLTVNGKPFETISVKAGDRLRLRVLNTSNARVLSFRFTDHVPMLIALDGQPVEPAALAGDLILAPGERADVMLDMALAPGAKASIEEVSGQDGLEIARFVYHPSETAREHPLDAPMRLAANPLVRGLELGDALSQDLLMEGGAMGGMAGARMGGEMMDMRALVGRGMAWAFNGVVGMEQTPLLSAARGRTVRIPMINDTGWPHAIHIHGHHFRVLERNGAPVAGEAWKDTVLVAPRERVVVAFVADNPGKWMLHCHMLEHQAAGMGTWFAVA
ncbi:multicopper oxidase family protein [Breoghania sp. L-A4]|uniref:multicopper oxidase family protein n=1 Tax=Breoghania sp. L-A4 TaxID=2304600 RepID=UPI000E358152|nr:multicopper oxidase family protein [Breoghania sp. L-A4]AXS40151.1 multicopper oxidase family protein [Breoghania sp. L-A4]